MVGQDAVRERIQKVSSGGGGAGGGVCVCVGGGSPALTFFRVSINLFYRWERGFNLLLDVDTYIIPKKTQYTPKSVPSSAHQRNVSLAADSGPTLNAGCIASRFFRGSGPVFLRKPIALRFSKGVRTPVTPLVPRMA